MSILSKAHFHNERSAFKFLEATLWPDGPECPHCGACDGKIYKIKATAKKGSKKRGVRMGVHKCGHCRKQFTVKVGTVFEHGRIPLHKMLQAVYLMCASKKGISSHQLHRTLEITYKSAWFLTHRIREAMRDGTLGPLGGEGQVVEADETYIGKRKANKMQDIFINGKGFVKRGGTRNQMKIVTLVERSGRARSVQVNSVTANAVRDILVRNVDRQSTLMTDEANVYTGVGKEFSTHGSVNHSKGIYGKGPVHTNTIEGFFSIFKRGMKGVYQHCNEKHLHRYLNEFDFRYSERSITDHERTEKALQGVKGKRLMYRQPA